MKRRLSLTMPNPHGESSDGGVACDRWQWQIRHIPAICQFLESFPTVSVKGGGGGLGWGGQNHRVSGGLNHPEAEEVLK